MSNVATQQSEQEVKTDMIVKPDEVTRGMDAQAVLKLTKEVDINAPRWELTSKESAAIPAGMVVKPWDFIHMQDKITEVEKEQQNRRGSLAIALFAWAAECKSLAEFEALCLNIRHAAGWKDSKGNYYYPEQFKNYKSRIVTHWKTTEYKGVKIPNPDDTAKLPKILENGKLHKTELEVRPFRNMSEYYDHCSGLKEAARNAKASKEQTIKSEVTETGGVTVTPTTTTTETTEGKVEVEKEVDTFTATLAHLQVLYAQANPAEQAKMVKRVKSLEQDIRKAQEARFKEEEQQKAAS